MYVDVPQLGILEELEGEKVAADFRRSRRQAGNLAGRRLFPIGIISLFHFLTMLISRYRGKHAEKNWPYHRSTYIHTTDGTAN